jgi:hypothetical protein
MNKRSKTSTEYEVTYSESIGLVFASVWRRRYIGSTLRTDSFAAGSGKTREIAKVGADKLIADLRTREA